MIRSLPQMLVAALFTMAMSTPLWAEEVRTDLTSGNSVYTAIYKPDSKTLECVSNNVNCVWRTTVATGVPTQGDWSGRGTPAGPVFVFTQSTGVSFALLHFRDGGTTVPTSGESLRGNIGAGRLRSATWQPGQYGAKVTVVTRQDRTQRTYAWDINMGGNHKEIAPVQTVTLAPVRYTLPGTTLSVELPVGFSARWDADSECAGLVPDETQRMGLIMHAAEPDENLSLFADEFMKLIGPAMGAPDLKQVAGEQTTLGGSIPGLLRLAQGTMKGKAGTFAFVFGAHPKHTFVFVFGAPTADYDTYAGTFYEMLRSVRTN